MSPSLTYGVNHLGLEMSPVAGPESVPCAVFRIGLASLEAHLLPETPVDRPGHALPRNCLLNEEMLHRPLKRA